MKVYKGVVVIFIIHWIQMNVARTQIKRSPVMSKANSAGNMYDQERIHKFLQNRYLKIDFLTLYRVNLLKASGKVKRK